MSAIEIMDPKMDFKTNLSKDSTIQAIVDSKKIKLPEELTTKEVTHRTIGSTNICLQCSWTDLLMSLLVRRCFGSRDCPYRIQFSASGSISALPNRITGLSYLYDQKIYQNDKFLKPYVDAFYGCIGYVQDMVKMTPYLREEDYIISVVNIPVPTSDYITIVDTDSLYCIDLEELNQGLMDAEYEIADQLTKKKKKKAQQDQPTYNDYDGLNARLKFRRALLQLLSSLHQKFSIQKKDIVANNINSCSKNLEVIRETLDQAASDSGYFFEDLPKTLLCHLPPRKIQTLTKKETYQHITDMLNHLNQILELSAITSFHAIASKLDEFSRQPRNLLARVYLQISVFAGNGKYFNYYEISEIVQVYPQSILPLTSFQWARKF